MGFCQQSFKLKSLKSCSNRHYFHPVAPPKKRHDDDADGRLNLHWLWIFGENKVDDGWGGEGCIEKKSKGGLWNETQHSKIVLDWHGRNPVFLPKKRKQESGIWKSSMILAKNPWCMGLWVARKRSISFRHWLSMSTWQAELGSTEEGAIKKANQRWEVGINEQKSHFPLKHSKKIIMPKYQLGVLDSTLKRIVNESTRRLETAWEPIRSAWLCASGHAWMGMNECTCMHAWNGMEWNGN